MCAQPSIISEPTTLLPNEELISSIFTAAAPSVVNIDTYQSHSPSGGGGGLGLGLGGVPPPPSQPSQPLNSFEVR